MRNQVIVQEIQKQMELGIGISDIKEFLLKKGENLDDYAAIFSYMEERERPKGKYITAGVVLLLVGLIAILTARPVSGSPALSFESSGDFRRLEELFFKPVFALLSVVLGVIFLVKKNSIGNNLLRLVFFSFFLLTSIVC